MSQSLREASIAENPGVNWLEAGGDQQPVARVLAASGQLAADETVASSAPAGEGNMNLTLRVTIQGSRASRTVIVKQSRPWVEKYDFIAAPWDRALVEAAFYAKVERIDAVARQMPRLLGVDVASRAIVLEDLGEGSDLTSVYGSHAIDGAILASLGGYLAALHRETRGTADNAMANRTMRELNHAHMFVIPLQGGAAALDADAPGLAQAAAELRRDAGYMRRVDELGRRYLGSGPCLLHGDFFPGSWLSTGRGIVVIDPEFCFYGDPEFDLGVTVAHLALAAVPRAEVGAFLRAYDQPFDGQLLSAFAANEVMRRLIGVAKLPLAADMPRPDLLRRSARAMQGEDWTLLWN